jgi:hypothetical protein
VLTAAVGAGHWNGPARSDAAQIADSFASKIMLIDDARDGNAAEDWQIVY